MGWFVVNVLAPFGLPVVGMLILKLLPLPATVAPNTRLLATVKDGQACWGVVAMGASTLYDSWGVPDLGWLVGVQVLSMLAAMLLAAGGAAFSTPLLTESAGGKAAWCAHYKTFVASVVLSVSAAFVYTFVHFAVEAYGKP
jgi:hypothetical protein